MPREEYAADPFRGCQDFADLLGQVSASYASAKRVAAFALRHAYLSDGLHDALLLELASGPSHARLNKLYVLDLLCQDGSERGGGVYRELTAPKITEVVEAVVSEEVAGRVNAIAVLQLLERWKLKGIFTNQDLEEGMEVARKASRIPIGQGDEQGLGKTEATHRMEEDRERHKREREDVWSRGREDEGEEDAEFHTAWTLAARDEEKRAQGWDALRWEREENARYLPGEAFSIWETRLKQHGYLGREN
ncbi:CTD kinase subunit gamma CTK3-domain-containing protein [Piptocephalis cylindrospora]|uniref:CTD kinase subunit gamma CTK3-domain-containing protein n=1 Tax=Piptocephalis cylindrospora TaxID=1907219 RepID=A0A4P9Y7B6_9FUNG|nr:CTD kinase subunit gamma CTK3-domain-containing protein [Piptocephalis cylindrospora]|eukprot:RKP14614.1 CTD kinase subunit gamma CTK3-domain-containing protein [Piptocephalis cylindrospora]